MIWPRAWNLFRARATDRGIILRDNWGLAVTGDVNGDLVVVNGERHPFSLHIPKVDDPVPENIGSLLTWRSRIPKKLYGRDAEFAELRRWCDEPAAIRVRALCGDGGAGKSRLAFELAEALRGEGWCAGQLVDPAQPVAFPLSKRGVLLVIDYAEQYPAAVGRLLGILKNSEFAEVRLRVLLLNRNRESMQALVDRHVEWFHSAPIELRPLASADISWALFQEGWSEMAKLRDVSATLPLDRGAFDAWFQRDTAHAQPLIILSFALNLLYDPSATHLSRAEILQRLVQRERDRIAREVEQHGLQAEGVLLLKALAAIPGHLTASDVDSMAKHLSHPGINVPAAVDLQRTSLWRHGELPEIQPDLLASVLIHAVLRDYLSDPQTAGPWVWSALAVDAPSKEALKARLRRIARLSADRQQSATQEYFSNSVVAALARYIAQDDDKARLIDELLNREVRLAWPLQPLALSAAQGLVRICESRCRHDFATYAPVLADSLNVLFVRLAESGERAASLAAIRRAVEIFEQLAQENFPTFAPDLARSLSNLSTGLGQSGEPAAGLAAIRRTVEIFEQLAQENFPTFAPDLARSLNNLSIRLGEFDERASLAAIRRAVEIREQLAKDNFPAHAPDLARSLNNLSIRLGESGERAASLTAARRSMEIREQLAKENFPAYAPDLARSLNNLSIRLGESGERPAALAAIRRTVEIHEQLATHNFPAYAPDLARSLNNLSFHLRESGEPAAGLAAIRRAVEIREQLAKENLAAYAPDLARSLNNLSNYMMDSDPAQAEETLRRAIELIRPFVNSTTTARQRLRAMQGKLRKLTAGER